MARSATAGSSSARCVPASPPARRPTMLLCPPYVYLPAVRDWLQGSPIALGAQDLSDKPGTGAYTGEVSGADAARRRLQPRDRRPLRAAGALRRDGRRRCRRSSRLRKAPGSCRSCASAKRSSSAKRGRRARSSSGRSLPSWTPRALRRSRRPSSPTSPSGRSARDGPPRPSRRRKSTPSSAAWSRRGMLQLPPV